MPVKKWLMGSLALGKPVRISATPPYGKEEKRKVLVVRLKRRVNRAITTGTHKLLLILLFLFCHICVGV